MGLAELQRSCGPTAFRTYPENVIDPGSCHAYALRQLRQLLREKSPNLFCAEGVAKVELYYHDAARNQFRSRQLNDLTELQQKTPCNARLRDTVRACQFVFVGAFSGRDRLYVSQDMLTWLMTILQTMPEFLEFLFPFGKQLYTYDFQFSSFRHETRLADHFKSLEITELGRSGRRFQICYNLKAVESKREDPCWPWSSRQTAVYHSFDVVKIQSTWIVVKANDEIRNRLKEVEAAALTKDPGLYSDLKKTFANSLDCHLTVADWCAENWRWYINWFEIRLEETTARAILNNVSSVAPETAIMPTTTMPQASLSQPQPVHSRTWTYRPPARVTTTQSQQQGVHAYAMQNIVPQAPSAQLGAGVMEAEEPPELPPDLDLEKTSSNDTDLKAKAFDIDELQNTQSMESRASESILILKSNITILQELSAYYEELLKSQDLEQPFRDSINGAVRNFARRILRITTDLQGHLGRMQTLVKLAADRKVMVYSLVEYQNMQQTKRFANEAARSAERMEGMTQRMEDLTKRTTWETFIMRVLAVVTVVFLPPTFVSTFMSANIVEYKPENSGITTGSTSLGGVKFFLALTVPIMVAIFGGTGGWIWIEKRYG